MLVLQGKHGFAGAVVNAGDNARVLPEGRLGESELSNFN